MENVCYIVGAGDNSGTNFTKKENDFVIAADGGFEKIQMCIRDRFYMVDGPAQGEIVEKKSRFIANVFPVDSEEQALEIIEKTKKQYWDARHNLSLIHI